MPRGRGHRVREVLAGFLVLCVVLMSIGQVWALAATGGNPPGQVPAAPMLAHHHAAAMAHDNADRSCDGSEPRHGHTCCFASFCASLVLALPTAVSITLPAMRLEAGKPIIASTRAKGVGRAPDPPPPRQAA